MKTLCPFIWPIVFKVPKFMTVIISREPGVLELLEDVLGLP